MDKSSIFRNTVSWIFALAVVADGILNLFWGNDPGLGVAFLLLSLLYFPPIDRKIKQWLGQNIPLLPKIVLALAIIWVTGSVGALAEGFIF
jgi:hypothetical protein